MWITGVVLPNRPLVFLWFVHTKVVCNSIENYFTLCLQNAGYVIFKLLYELN